MSNNRVQKHAVQKRTLKLDNQKIQFDEKNSDGSLAGKSFCF